MMAPSLHVADELSIEKVRCAPFHAALGVDPVGTAGSYDVFLCVEIPLPWQRDISMEEPFLTVLGAGTASVVGADGRRIRPQGIVPAPGAEGWTRVLVHERPARAGEGSVPAGGPYRRTEWWVQPDEAVDLCRAVVDADAEVLARFEPRKVPSPEGVVDLYVCTHGKRDVCCGAQGATLHDQLALAQAQLAPEDGSMDRSGWRLWRVSHTGGHRFAPTALTFPDGYAWAHLDPELAFGLATRTADPARARRHCRGVASLPGGPAQAADAAVLAEVGWDWAGATRTVTVTGFDRASMATVLRVDGELGDGRACAFDVQVELERHVPQVTCGSIAAPEYSVEPAWRVASVAPIPPA